jgi:hypothetical protein
MPKVHGKGLVIIINGKDLSGYSNKHDFKRSADKHDLTCFGANAHEYGGGLLDGESGLEGFYDSTLVNGPRAVLEPLLGTNVTLTRRPEGTGTGKPQDSVTVLVGEYVETQPVADFITWACQLQLSGDVASTYQA